VRILGFDDQMKVVALHAVVHQAEAEAFLAHAERSLDTADARLAAQVWQSATDAECHVNGKAGGQRGAHPVVDALGPGAALAARVFPSATPRAVLELRLHGTLAVTLRRTVALGNGSHARSHFGLEIS
jgi:hypothetical protein